MISIELSSKNVYATVSKKIQPFNHYRYNINMMFLIILHSKLEVMVYTDQLQSPRLQPPVNQGVSTEREKLEVT